jgi:hypothetical protein
MTVPGTPSSITPRLGCAQNYTVQVWQWERPISPVPAPAPRLRYVTDLTGIIQLYWERTIDDYSEARVRFRPQKGDDCCQKLTPKWNSKGELIDAGIWPWSHEIIIYRDGDPVWSGPVFSFDETVTPSEDTDFIQINARDHLAWLDRRVIHTKLPFPGPQLYDLVDIARFIILDAFGTRDSIGITAANLPVYPPSGRKGNRTTRPSEARAGDELREVARGGIDFTCIGRQIIVKGVRRDPDVGCPELRNSDFQAGAEIRIVGAEAATVGYAVGKPPVETEGETPDPPPIGIAYAPGVPNGSSDPKRGVHPYFGLIESLTNASETDSIDFLMWMAQELVDENMPPPRSLSIPAGSMLSPEANVSVHELIPSRHFKVAIRGTCSQLTQYMRLSHVEASWEPNTPERIGVTFIPGNALVEEPDS